MARKKKHEEHANHEAWAIPYGDLVTLLFALFTVMYAMSSVNEGKFRVLSDSLIAAFHGAPKRAARRAIPTSPNRPSHRLRPRRSFAWSARCRTRCRG
jgi:chemotaxis protein MotB